MTHRESTGWPGCTVIAAADAVDELWMTCVDAASRGFPELRGLYPWRHLESRAADNQVLWWGASIWAAMISEDKTQHPSSAPSHRYWPVTNWDPCCQQPCWNLMLSTSVKAVPPWGSLPPHWACDWWLGGELPYTHVEQQWAWISHHLHTAVCKTARLIVTLSKIEVN